MVNKHDNIRTGPAKPTVASCAYATQILLGLKKPKKARKKRAPMSYDNPEAKIRTEIIKALKANNCAVFRLEPSTNARWGVADILVFSHKHKTTNFLEVKSMTGYLWEEQLRFQKLCMECHSRYFVVRSVEEALTAIAL